MILEVERWMPSKGCFEMLVVESSHQNQLLGLCASSPMLIITEGVTCWSRQASRSVIGYQSSRCSLLLAFCFTISALYTIVLLQAFVYVYKSYGHSLICCACVYVCSTSKPFANSRIWCSWMLWCSWGLPQC